MSSIFYTISDLMFKLYSDPAPGPTPVPTPYTPFDWLSNMALTQTGDFIGCLAILLVAVAFIGGLFFFASKRNGKTKIISVGIAAILLASLCTLVCINAANAEPEISKGVYTADHIDILNHSDGSGWEFGQEPYSNRQVFTNTTTDKNIVIDGIGINAYTEIPLQMGTWTCYSETLQQEVFSGTVGDSQALPKSIELAPGEKTIFLWNSNITTEEAILLTYQTPAAVGYQCSYKDTPVPPVTTHNLSVNLNNGVLTEKGAQGVRDDGWVETASAETGKTTWNKSIEGNETTTEEAFAIWNKLLKEGSITHPGGGNANVSVIPDNKYVTEDTQYIINWSIVPIEMIHGKLIYKGESSLNGTAVSVLSTDNLELLYQTFSDVNGNYELPSYLVENDDVYIKTLLRRSGTSIALAGSDYTWKKGSSSIDDITLEQSIQISGTVMDTDASTIISNANVDIYTMPYDKAGNGLLDNMPVYHNKTNYDGSFSCYVNAYSTNKKNPSRIFIKGCKDGYNSSVIRTTGYYQESNAPKTDVIVPLTKLDNCYALCGTITDSSALPVSGLGVIMEPFPGSVIDINNLFYLGETDEDGQYCIYIPSEVCGDIRAGKALSDESNFYYKHFEQKVPAKDSYVNDITWTSHKLVVKVSNEDLPDFVPISQAWIKTPDVAYTEYTNAFIEGTSVEHAINSLGMPEIDNTGHAPLYWTFTNTILESDESGVLNWSKNPVEMISLNNREFPTFDDEGRKVLADMGLHYLPGIRCFSMEVSPDSSLRNICNKLLEIGEKYKNKMGKMFVENTYGYEFISYSGIEKTDSGVDWIYIQWDDGSSAEVMITLNPAWIGDEGLSFLAEHDWYSIYSVNIYKYYELGTDMKVPIEELNKLAKEYEAKTGSPLITLGDKRDKLTFWYESPSPLAVDYQTVYANVSVGVFPQCEGSGKLLCNGQAFNEPFTIDLYDGCHLEKAEEANKITVYVYEGENVREQYVFTASPAVGWSTQSVDIDPRWSSWDTSFSIIGTFVEDKQVNQAENTGNKLNGDANLQKSEENAQENSGQDLQNEEYEDITSSDSVVDKADSVAENESIPEPIKWATTALWYVFGWFMII